MPKPRYRTPPEILSQPVRAYRFPASERDQKTDAEVQKRINAAIDYFGIDDGPFKWELLSLTLLLRTFPTAFTVLNKPRGGAKKNSDDAYCDLADKFDRYIGKDPSLPESVHAERWLARWERIKVGKETITSPKALLRAVRRGRAGRPDWSEQMMIRYGTQLAMAGYAAGSPLSAKKLEP